MLCDVWPNSEDVLDWCCAVGKGIYNYVDEKWITTLLRTKNNRNVGLVIGIKKAKTVPSTGKVIATVFWDSQRIIFNDYLESGKTVKGEYYSSFENLSVGKTSSIGFHFQHDNATAHALAVASKKLMEIGFQLVSDRYPDFPYLTSTDYYLFPNMKKILAV